MQTGIFRTNGGPHSVDDEAYVSASMLLEAIKVDPQSPRRSQLEMAKDRARPLLADVFHGHHEKVKSGERSKLAAGDHSRLSQPFDISEHTDVDSAVNDAVAIVQPLLTNGQLFQGGDVTSDHQHLVDHVTLVTRQRIEMDLRTSMWNERSWHADRNPDNDHAKAFRARRGAVPAAVGA